jgi:hypothetical protein
MRDISKNEFIMKMFPIGDDNDDNDDNDYNESDDESDYD